MSNVKSNPLTNTLTDQVANNQVHITTQSPFVSQKKLSSPDPSFKQQFYYDVYCRKLFPHLVSSSDVNRKQTNQVADSPLAGYLKE